MRRAYSRIREEFFEVTVDWNLGNACSFGCSYCSPYFHAGTNPFPDIAMAKLFVDKIAEKHKLSNRTIRFSLIGGEVTEYPHLYDLCAHIRSYGYVVELKTNGSLSLAEWGRFAPVINSVHFTYHEGKLSYDHLVQVSELLEANMIQIIASFAAPPQKFASVYSRLMDFRERFPQALYTELQLLYRDHTGRSQLLGYTPEQMALYEAAIQHVDLQDFVIEHDDGSHETLSVGDDAILHKKNCFTGMQCRIGADQIVVGQDGRIRRGWCFVGGVLGTIQEGNFEKPDDAVICTKPSCNNPLDITAMKFQE